MIKLPPDIDETSPPRNPPVRRLKAFLSTFGICALLGTWYLVHSVVHPGLGHHHCPGGVLDSDGKCKSEWAPTNNCSNSWVLSKISPHDHIARTNITLNAEVPSHLFSAQQTSGSIAFLTGDSEHIRVEVSVVYSHWDEPNPSAVRVCKIGKDDGSEGVSIGLALSKSAHPPQMFMDQGSEKTPEIDFTIAVHLPRRSTFKNFETDMPHWVQKFSLPDVSFETVKLMSPSAEINSFDLSLNRGHVKTSDAEISGVFRVTEELSLETINGDIRAGVEMVYESGKNATALCMKTQNGSITARAKLQRADSKARQGGRYEVKAATLHGPIDLEVLDAHLLSILDLSSTNSYGLSQVVLHPSYEGSFSIASDGHGEIQALHRYGPEDDPTGMGRQRIVEVLEERVGVLEGNAYWEEDNRERGSVVVQGIQRCGENITVASLRIHHPEVPNM